MSDDRPELSVTFPSGKTPSQMKRTEAHEVVVVASPDPLQQARSQGPDVNRAWMTNDIEKPMVQSVGFSVLSLCYLGMACMFLSWAWDALQEWREDGLLGVLLLCIPAIIFGYLGGRGLWNARRSRKPLIPVDDEE